MAISYSTATQIRLQRLFDTCIISDDKYADVDYCLKQIVKGNERYKTVSEAIRMPWHVTGILHFMSSDCDFKVHLHNGDSLNGRTVNIPAGYPKKNRPPFTWEQSAEDLLQYYRFDKWSDWSIAGMLYHLLTISGDSHKEMAGKLSKMWCFCNHYSSDTTDDTIKCGGAVLLRRMAEKKMIPIETSYGRRLDAIVKLGSEIEYVPNRSFTKTCELQRLLNLSGAYLREDGRAGPLTSGAYHAITKLYLFGDPEEIK